MTQPLPVEIKIDSKSIKGVQEALDKYGQEAVKGLSDVVRATAFELAGNIVKGIQRGPRTGRVYESYSPQRTHQASAPGEAPKTDTGRLASSVDFEFKGLSAQVFSSVMYAVYLEAGTRTMAPRPIWNPERDKIAPKAAKRAAARIARMNGGTL